MKEARPVAKGECVEMRAQKKRASDSTGARFEKPGIRESLLSALDQSGLLAHAVAEVVELGAADLALVGDFNLGNAWGVERENTLNAFAVGNLADGERSIHTGTATSEDDACEDLDTLFATFHNAGVNLDGVANVEVCNFALKLLLLDLIDDVHGVVLYFK
jgi:hypothetical protein